MKKLINIIIILSWALTSFAQLEYENTFNYTELNEPIRLVINENGIYYHIPEYKGNILAMWVSKGVHCDTSNVFFQKEIIGLKNSLYSLQERYIARGKILNELNEINSDLNQEVSIMIADNKLKNDEIDKLALSLKETKSKLNIHRLGKWVVIVGTVVVTVIVIVNGQQ